MIFWFQCVSRCLFKEVFVFIGFIYPSHCSNCVYSWGSLWRSYIHMYMHVHDCFICVWTVAGMGYGKKSELLFWKMSLNGIFRMQPQILLSVVPFIFPFNRSCLWKPLVLLYFTLGLPAFTHPDTPHLTRSCFQWLLISLFLEVHSSLNFAEFETQTDQAYLRN